MKIKLFTFIAAIAAVCCMLAVFVSASDRTSITYTDVDNVTHEVPIVKYDDATANTVASVLGNNSTMQECFADDSSYVILKATDGSLTAYPTWYIIEPYGTNTQYVAISEIEYGYVNSKSDKTYEKGAIRYIEFPNGMTEVRSNGVFTTYESNVTDVYIPSSVERIGTQNTGNISPFNSHKSLKRVFIAENSQIVDIKSGSFSESTVEYFQFENLTNIVSINGFTGCTYLSGEVDLSNSKLEVLKDGVFRGDKLITKISLPNTLVTIENEAFSGCTNAYFASDFLPSSLTNIGPYFMAGSKHVNNTLVFPVGVTTVPAEFMNNASVANAQGTLNLVFLGKMTDMRLNGSSYATWAESVNVYLAQNTLSDYNGSIYSFKDAQAGTLGSATSQSGTLFIKPSNSSPETTTQVTDQYMKLIFCGNNGSVELSYMLTANGVNITADRGTFEMDGHTHFTSRALDCNGDTCIVCDTFVKLDHQKSQFVSNEYPDGYANKGYKNYLCNICNKNFLADETVDAIFIASEKNGYSTNGADGIAFGGYIIDTAMLKMFNSTHPQNELKFGVLIVNPNYVGESFMSDGIINAQKGALQVDISETEYSSVSISITGFKDDYSSIELVFALYAYTDPSEVDFIQSQHTVCAKTSIVKADATLYTVSLDSVKKATAATSEYVVPAKEEIE